MATESIHTRGSDETSAALADRYGRVEVSFPFVSDGLRIGRDTVGTAVLDRVAIGGRVSFEVELMPGQCVFLVHRGTMAIQHGSRDPELLAAGEARITTQARPLRVTTRDVVNDVITLSPGALDEVAATLAGSDSAPVRITSSEPVSPSAVAHLASVRAQVQRSAHRVPADLGADAARLMHASLSRLMAAAVLATFPNTAVTGPDRVDRHDAHPDSVRRAVGFIEAHPDLNITVTDIARHAYVSVRAIQLAFRRHLDTTPMVYLRRVRLDLARNDLRAALPEDGSTVTEIAMRWGYADLSRFAADYRESYGEHPHITLQHADG